MNELSYAAPGTTRLRGSAVPWLIAAAVWGVAGSVAVAILDFRALWPVPRGTPIRPMALAALDFLTAGVTLIGAFALAATGVAVERRWRGVIFAALIIAVSLAPMPVSRWAWNWIIVQHALVLED